MAIEWREVAGWNGLYRVSSAGDVLSPARVIVRPNGVRVQRRARILKPSLCNGYWRVTLRGEGRNERAYVHHIVCEAWHGSRPIGKEVAHGDNDRRNNVPSNLRWATRLENIKDKEAHGTQPKGERIWIAKLTDEDVVDIRKSSEPQKVLAARFGVSQSVISLAKRGITWAHVQVPE